MPVFRSGEICFLLLMLTTLPSLSIMLLGASSLALGLTIASSITVIMFAWRARHSSLSLSSARSRSAGIFLLAAAVILHGVVAMSFTGFFDWSRAIFSLGLIIMFLITAICLHQALSSMPASRIVTVMRGCFIVFAAEGLLALAGTPSLGPSYHHMPIIFFIEPSQYSLSFLPFLTFLVMRERGTAAFIVIATTLALGLLIQSLTLLVGLAVAVGLMFSLRRFFLLVLLLVPALMAADANYFLDRLAFGEDAENLSTLAYLQGWERAWLNIQATHGVGVGFQQFGLVGELGFFQERIEALFTAIGLNLLDGGSNGSKIIGEFGLIGVFVVLAYIAMVFRAVVIVKRRDPEMRDRAHEQLFAAFIVAGFVEFFVRGGGYMTPGTILLVTGSFWMFTRRKLPMPPTIPLPICRYK